MYRLPQEVGGGCTYGGKTEGLHPTVKGFLRWVLSAWPFALLAFTELRFK